jgi:hypothetical protein
MTTIIIIFALSLRTTVNLFFDNIYEFNAGYHSTGKIR